LRADPHLGASLRLHTAHTERTLEQYRGFVLWPSPLALCTLTQGLQDLSIDRHVQESHASLQRLLAASKPTPGAWVRFYSLRGKGAEESRELGGRVSR
jgi:hypothetical protein